VASAGVAVPGEGEALLLVWQGDAARGAALAGELSARSGQTLALGVPTRLDAPYSWQPKAALTLYAAPLGPAP
jgi:hypothetical protein